MADNVKLQQAVADNPESNVFEKAGDFLLSPNYPLELLGFVPSRPPFLNALEDFGLEPREDLILSSLPLSRSFLSDFIEQKEEEKTCPEYRKKRQGVSLAWVISLLNESYA